MTARTSLTMIAFAVLGYFVQALPVQALPVQAELQQAQQFTLSAPGLGLTSKAYLTEAKLEVIDSQGGVNTYARDLNYDTADGQWMGYRNKTTGKILRWPSSNSGNLQIGEATAAGVQFSASRMQIQSLPGQPRANPVNPLNNPNNNPNSNPLGNRPFGGALQGGNRPMLPADGTLQQWEIEYQGKQWKSFGTSDYFSRVIANPINRLPGPQAIHLVSYDAGGSAWAMAQRGTKIGCIAEVSSTAMWWVAPAGPGIVRLQMQNDGQVWAISANDRTGLRLSLVSQDPRQLWRVSHGHLAPNQFLLENAQFVGNYLTHLGGGNLGMQPMLALPTQMWVPIAPPPVFVNTLQPFWRNISREIRPNPPLPPAEVELVNSHKYALTVLVGDLRSGQVVKEVRVESNRSTTITVERDPGSTLVEVVEIQSPLGGWNRQEYVTQIPSVSLYDLSVYEEFLQSIAIDRTGKSPNPIEDINYQPKSVGLLALPPGEALPERGQLDVYDQAKSANNAGAVRRLDPKRFEKPKADPLESILEGIQKKNPPGGRRF